MAVAATTTRNQLHQHRWHSNICLPHLQATTRRTNLLLDVLAVNCAVSLRAYLWSDCESLGSCELHVNEVVVVAAVAIVGAAAVVVGQI